MSVKGFFIQDLEQHLGQEMPHLELDHLNNEPLFSLPQDNTVAYFS